MGNANEAVKVNGEKSAGTTVRLKEENTLSCGETVKQLLLQDSPRSTLRYCLLAQKTFLPVI